MVGAVGKNKWDQRKMSSFRIIPLKGWQQTSRREKRKYVAKEPSLKQSHSFLKRDA